MPHGVSVLAPNTSAFGHGLICNSLANGTPFVVALLLVQRHDRSAVLLLLIPGQDYCGFLISLSL